MIFYLKFFILFKKYYINYYFNKYKFYHLVKLLFIINPLIIKNDYYNYQLVFLNYIIILNIIIILNFIVN